MSAPSLSPADSSRGLSRWGLKILASRFWSSLECSATASDACSSNSAWACELRVPAEKKAPMLVAWAPSSSLSDSLRGLNRFGDSMDASRRSCSLSDISGVGGAPGPDDSSSGSCATARESEAIAEICCSWCSLSKSCAPASSCSACLLSVAGSSVFESGLLCAVVIDSSTGGAERAAGLRSAKRVRLDGAGAAMISGSSFPPLT